MLALSNDYTHGSGNGASGGGHAYLNRREVRANNVTGALPPLETTTDERWNNSHSSGFDFEEMIRSLHDLFEHDRQVASQPDATRCGICYLHHSVNELHYNEEGFYTCDECERSLGHHHITMLHRQQKL
jgi:hypothetical protein